jgi:hypothetical protein
MIGSRCHVHIAAHLHGLGLIILTISAAFLWQIEKSSDCDLSKYSVQYEYVQTSIVTSTANTDMKPSKIRTNDDP